MCKDKNKKENKNAYKPIYNEEKKTIYIEQRNNEIVIAKGYLHSIFGRTAPFEVKLNKDISEFTAYEIIDMYKILNNPSLDSLIAINSVLSLYTQYCIGKGEVEDNQNHFLEITTDMMNGCVNKAVQRLRYVNFNQIKDWCKELPNVCDQFVLMGLFCGIKGKDFCELLNATLSDFITETEFVTCTGRKIQVPVELYNIAIEASEEEYYIAMTGNGLKQMPYKSDDTHIVKSYPNVQEGTNDFYKGRRMYNKILRIFDNLGIKDYMKASSVVESGMLEFIRVEKEKRGCDMEDLLKDAEFCKVVKQQYDKTIVPSTFVRKYGDLFV